MVKTFRIFQYNFVSAINNKFTSMIVVFNNDYMLFCKSKSMVLC